MSRLDRTRVQISIVFWKQVDVVENEALPRVQAGGDVVADVH